MSINTESKIAALEKYIGIGNNLLNNGHVHDRDLLFDVVEVLRQRKILYNSEVELDKLKREEREDYQGAQAEWISENIDLFERDSSAASRYFGKSSNPTSRRRTDWIAARVYGAIGTVVGMFYETEYFERLRDANDSLSGFNSRRKEALDRQRQVERHISKQKTKVDRLATEVWHEINKLELDSRGMPEGVEDPERTLFSAILYYRGIKSSDSRVV